MIDACFFYYLLTFVCVLRLPNTFTIRTITNLFWKINKKGNVIFWNVIYWNNQFLIHPHPNQRNLLLTPRMFHGLFGQTKVILISNDNFRKTKNIIVKCIFNKQLYV